MGGVGGWRRGGDFWGGLGCCGEKVEEVGLIQQCKVQEVHIIGSSSGDETCKWDCYQMERLEKMELEAHYGLWQRFRIASTPDESSFTGKPLEQKDDSNVTPDSSNICTNDNQVDQNAAECVDERVALANLIANLTLDTEENKTILKQLKKANASLTQELEKCKTNLDETNSALGEAISCRDSCLIALQNKQNEFEKYKAFNDRTIDYEILQTKTKAFLEVNELQCPSCKKCHYSANHDECVLEYLSRLNPRASAQNKDAKSHKTTKRYMPVEKSRASKKPERQISTGHRFSNKKTTTVPEKTMNPRSCLRWKPTGLGILKTVLS
ncbi:hypothetical protein Tco_0729441 [Tanacetum coccineum]|uniref:Uncharacterized protein n=1 Tax=Tanacetum coccineum TaxID=301880 RepID=A0ABQ4YPE0_9ASTR